jgi:hypothetical protein
MAFQGDGTKLTGDDGFLKKATFGTEIPGDGVTALPVGTYLVTKVAAASSFPTTALGGTGIAEGDILDVKTGVTITPAVDDDVVTLVLTDQCDISSWTMEFTRPEIDVTTLCNPQKVYRAGKVDMSGTLNGMYVTGTSDSVTGLLRQFLDIAKQDQDQSFDRFTKQDAILLGFFYLNRDTNIADEQLVIAPYQSYGYSLGGEQESAVTFSAPFRFGDLTYTDSGNSNVVTITPTYYRLGDGT